MPDDDDEEGVTTYEIRPVKGCWCLLRSFAKMTDLADLAKFARPADEADGTTSYDIRSGCSHKRQSSPEQPQLTPAAPGIANRSSKGHGALCSPLHTAHKEENKGVEEHLL